MDTRFLMLVDLAVNISCLFTTALLGYSWGTATADNSFATLLCLLCLCIFFIELRGNLNVYSTALRQILPNSRPRAEIRSFDGQLNRWTIGKLLAFAPMFFVAFIDFGYGALVYHNFLRPLSLFYIYEQIFAPFLLTGCLVFFVAGAVVMAVAFSRVKSFRVEGNGFPVFQTDKGTDGVR